MVVKDFTVGILIIVISMFPIGIVVKFITPNEWWVMPLIISLVTLFHYLFNLGWNIAFNGIKINDNKN